MFLLKTVAVFHLKIFLKIFSYYYLLLFIHLALINVQTIFQILGAKAKILSVPYKIVLIFLLIVNNRYCENFNEIL